MAAESKTGPIFVSGDMQSLPAGYGSPVADPNTDAGPSMIYQGIFLPDVRYPFMKDKVEGYTGVVPGHLSAPWVYNVDQIPATFSASNIAAAQQVVANAPMALATAGVTGVTPNIPIRPNTAGAFALNGAAVVNVIALDFGFAFGNVTAATAQIAVADSTQFIPGMPLVIGGVGNAGGTLPLLTACATIVDATHITLAAGALPAGTNAAAPIGTGNYWGPSPAGFPGQPQGLPFPDAALPYMAGGSGLLLDPRQTLSRAVSITSAAGSTGGTFVVRGFDIYGQAMTENLVSAGGAATVFGQKAFKYIRSVTPLFADAHNYTVGTSDTFGAAVRTESWEKQDIFWADLADVQTKANSGWLAGVTTSPATATTGDVRGTFQSGNNGNGTPETGGSDSNGTVSSLAMTGRKLMWMSAIGTYSDLQSRQATPQFLYGANQF